MCKIKYEKIEDNRIMEGKGTGFFCEIEIDNFPIKYGLFTANHILNENKIEKGNKINIEYFDGNSYIKKKIEIDEKRRVYTNKEMDYTCIELYESDNIKDYFKIDPILFNNKKYLKDSNVFILQYPEGNELSFSYGKILTLKDNKIFHNASTKEGSSGSPIIRRCDENYLIGLHFAGVRKNNMEYNLGTIFDSILNDINKPNEINCIYKIKDNENEIQLLHDYNLDISTWDNEEEKKLYLELKKINTKIFKENMEVYIDDKKIDFNYKYKINKNEDIKQIKVRYKFHKKLTNVSAMFFKCSSLISIDLSSFNTSNIYNMKSMFCYCSSLKSINLSSFDTSNVTNMGGIFFGCTSLNSINLSSFDTSNVTNMSGLFFNCSSLNSIDLSSFDTSNVKDMSLIFSCCSSLKSVNVISFKTSNVTNMSSMFFDCSSLNSIDLSSFNTSNVKDMNSMFSGCNSLKSLNLSSFNINNNTNINGMFFNCSSLNKKNIIFNKKDKNLLKEINKI